MQSMKSGDWVLLDEINLAQEGVLNRLASIVEGSYVMLNERADIVKTDRHPDFRIFFCMNPPYTSAGKKALPTHMRTRLTEIYVPELTEAIDLREII